MKTTVMNPVKAFTLIALGLAIAAMGIYVAEADDAASMRFASEPVGRVLGMSGDNAGDPVWAWLDHGSDRRQKRPSWRHRRWRNSMLILYRYRSDGSSVLDIAPTSDWCRTLSI